MDKRYEVYALADRFFYETPDRFAGEGRDTAPGYEVARRAVPEGWRAARIGDWLAMTPVDGEGRPRSGPAQGWKIHASATRENAERIAATVWDYCVPRSIPFKFVPGPHLLHLRNVKYATRDASGKFVTVYPADESQLQLVLEELGALLDGLEGPYILTDLRWNDGPLYVRYGAFARSFVVDERGTLVPAVRDGEGRLVPDRRAPSFQVPEWVTLPAFLEPQLAARNTTTVGDLPYRIEKALHFSNGGGVYAGTDTRDESRVVLKEGRPHAGLAADGADALTRLAREKYALERVSGLGVVPEVRDWFTLGEHSFLIALTRAYLSSAPLALLDEATCHLDPAAEARAERAFARRGGTLVVVAHRISSALRADRVLVMDGRRTAYGSHGELLERSALYRELVGSWSGPSQPALAHRDPDGVDPVAGPGLPRDGRHVVAYGPVGQMKASGDLRDGGALGGQ